MHKYLTIFWFEFDFSSYQPIPFGLKIGCGISAFDEEDALKILGTDVFKNERIPPLKKVISNINISELDQGHVIPNMKLTIYRGVWFPLGYDG